MKPLDFVRHAIAFEGDDCLIWPFYRMRDGRPQVRFQRRTQYVSNIVCLLAHGPQPAKHETAHVCGNGHLGCVNPKHLYWATREQNMADRVRHGGGNGRERNGNAKLTERDVEEMRSLKGKLTQRQIADRFGIRQPAVSRILSGARWP